MDARQNHSTWRIEALGHDQREFQELQNVTNMSATNPIYTGCSLSDQPDTYPIKPNYYEIFCRCILTTEFYRNVFAIFWLDLQQNK